MRRLIAISALSLFMMNAYSADAPALKSEKQKLSYAIGTQVGQSVARSIQQDELDLDSAVVAAAVQDALNGAKPRMSMEEMQAVMQAFQQKRAAEFRAKADANKKAGDEFLAANKKKEGVKELPSGLQYKVVKEGKGRQPKATDTVEVHYRGTHINGKEFDSSYSRNQPATFALNGILPGWQEALQLMKEGSKWQVFIPGQLGYGAGGGGGGIGPNETLLFDIELLSIK